MFFTEHLVVDKAWYLKGSLYSRTLDAWLTNMHANKAKLTAIFAKHGYKSPSYEFQKVRKLGPCFDQKLPRLCERKTR